MKRSHVIGAIGMAVVLSACAQRMSRESGGDVAIDAGTTGAWGSEFRGMNGWERIRGSAFAQPRDKGTRISLTIERAFNGSNYGWDVREGTCAAPGRMLGDSTSYPPLFVGSDERDSKVADIDVPLERGKGYTVNVYAMTGAQTRTIACGVLRP